MARTSREPFLVGRRVDGRRALPEGVTQWDLRSPRYRRLFPRVYVSATTPITTQLLAAAALLIAPPESVVSHHTAARSWGGVVPEDGLVHVTCVGPRLQVKGIRAHRAKAGVRFTRVGTVAVTTAGCGGAST